MPLFYVCIFFLIGVVASNQIPISYSVWVLSAVVCLVCAVIILVVNRGRKYVPERGWGERLGIFQLHPAAVPIQLLQVMPLLLLTAFSIGASRNLSSQPNLTDPDFIAHFNDDGVRYAVTGRISESPDIRDRYINLRVQTTRIRPASGIRHVPVRGDLLVRVAPGGDYKYGDQVVVNSLLQTPEETETFSYREYLARQGIHSVAPFADVGVMAQGQGSWLLAGIYALRGQLFDVLHAIFPAPESVLLAGILLGLDKGFSPALQQAFLDTGTSHIIAISGFNITIIAGLLIQSFGRIFGQRIGAFAALAGIVIYTIMVGADAAVLRAALMGGIALVVQRSGSMIAGINSLLVTAAVMVFAKPAVIKDPGFQLSFAATIGLIVYAEPFTARFARFMSRYFRVSVIRRFLPFISDFIILTFAAQLTTLPVIIHHFQRLSWTAILVNPLILPAQSAVMILGGVAMILGLVWLPAGNIAAVFAYPFASYTIRVIELFAGLGGSIVIVASPAVWLALGLAMLPWLFSVLNSVGWFENEEIPAWRTAVLIALISLSIFVWRINFTSAKGQLKMVLMDVGGGEAILVHTPTDRWILIGVGTSSDRVLDQLGRLIPFSQRELDWLVVAGTSEVQAHTLARVLDQYPASQVLLPSTQLYLRINIILQEMMHNDGVEGHYPQLGQKLDLGDGAEIEVLQITTRGLVLLLRWKNLAFLMPIGINFDSDPRFPPQSDILLMAESGFGPLNPADWIQKIQPEVILVSMDAANKGKLPVTSTFDDLQGIPILRTDLHGWIEITTNGEEMWISTAE